MPCNDSEPLSFHSNHLGREPFITWHCTPEKPSRTVGMSEWVQSVERRLEALSDALPGTERP